MFRKLQLRAHYSSEEDNLYEDFFAPALREATSYRRAVGFFSLGVLLNAPSAMSQIVGNDGKIQLIFGKLVAADDFEAIKSGIAQPWTTEDLPKFDELIAQNPESLLEYRIRLLAWLFAAGKLEMKVAIRPQGMFHQKIGILEDAFGDIVSFSGSMNETMYALDPRFNSEEISVFKKWNSGQAEYVDSHLETFEKLWSGETGSFTIVSPVPEAIEAGLNLVADRFPGRPTPKDEEDKVRSFIQSKSGKGNAKPANPEKLNGRPFGMRPHQLEALRSWSENNYNGILELATGAGKTITSIYAAAKTMRDNEGIALIVAVPYQDLADQWCEELKLFNIYPVKCYGSRAEWEPQIQSYLARNRGDQKESLAIVVVNKTLKTPHFQSYARQLDPERLFFIGDECHHHGSKAFEGKLLKGARFRIGLSATPFHYLDEERNQRLRAVYDRSVYQYTLADAVNDGVLTPYEYTPVPVELTDTEAQDYIDLSDQIARCFLAAKNGQSPESDERLKALLMRRARLIGAAANKLPALHGLLQEQGKVEPYSLFYCSDGRTTIDVEDDDSGEAALEDSVTAKQRHAVAQLLMKAGVNVSPFTSDENRWQRREILSQFKRGETEALVAIRCLDEGIDVPACRTAYLIASSRNPRQFIQRRGRILRRAEGKDYAKIYDFVVVLPSGSLPMDQVGSDFLRNELVRVADFARNSLYPASSIEPLMPWLSRYKLEHLAS
jgi:superfamily II DNA or RNA helicase